MRPFEQEYMKLMNKKIEGLGYDRTQDGYTWLIVLNNDKEIYLTSETPIEMEIRDVQ